MTNQETLELALNALKCLFGLPDKFTGEGGDVAVWRLGGSYRAQEAIKALEEALAKQDQGEPIKLRRGNILRCIETDELCTVWATSTTGKTLIKFGGNDFVGYTAEQIGELFWLEPESSDVEIAAEQSDNYAAFLAGVRFATAHPSKQEQGEPLKDMSEMNRTIAYCAASKLREIGYEWSGKNWVQQEQSAARGGEPVGEMKLSAIFEGMVVPVVPVELSAGTKLYTTPQQRKPLTDEQIETIRQQPQHHKGEFDYEFDELSFARAIEAAHGIKE